MKVFISVDMEGIGGIFRPEQTRKGTPEYEEARYLLIKEVNAAVNGAYEGGADEVIVADMHSSGFNFPLEELHENAKFVFGTNANTRLPFLDNTTDIAFLLGYHAMAGTQAALIDHTYSLVTAKMVVNGTELGEIEIDALRCGYYDVPVALVTGDDKGCAEAQKFLGNIETAVVKFAMARFGAMCYSPKKSRELVRSAACNAVKRAIEQPNSYTPYKIKGPYEIEVEYTNTKDADDVYVNGIDKFRAGPKTIIFKTDTVLDLFVTIM